MSNRILVSTRKGLFTVERARGKWKVAKSGFLGDNVTLALHDPRDGPRLCGAQSRPFRREAAPLRRATAGKNRGAGLSAEARRHEDTDMAGASRCRGALQASGRSRPAGRTSRACSGAARCPGGLFRSDDGGASWELNRPLWDDPRAQEMVRRRRRSARHPLDLVDPRDTDACGSACRAAACGPRATAARRWELRGRRHARRVHAARAAHDPDIQDVHMLAQCSGHPGQAVGAASQRHLPSRDVRRKLERDRRRPGRRYSASPWRPIPATRRPPGSCRRSRTRGASRSTASWW